MKKPLPASLRPLLVSLALLLTGLGFVFPSQAQPLDFVPPEQQAKTLAVLYFRYPDSPYLGYELREIAVPYTDSTEKALVQALLDGPSQTGSLLRPLYPAGTQVLSVLAEGNKLFVTFNEAFLSPMAGEGSLIGESVTQAEITRRQLALSALANTLTQSGIYREVQVLVQSQSKTTASLRLSKRYLLEDSDAIPDPLLREEEAIITPGQAAGLWLMAWQGRNQAVLSRGIKVDLSGTRDEASFPNLKDLPLLLAFETSQGRIAPGGFAATVTADCTLSNVQGQEHLLLAFPLALVLEDGIWKVSLSSLSNLLEAAQ